MVPLPQGQPSQQAEKKEGEQGQHHHKDNQQIEDLELQRDIHQCDHHHVLMM